MIGYQKVHLLDASEMIGDEKLRSVISEFFCPLNEDVQDFLQDKAIEFSKQGISSTHLVFASYRGVPALAGYFTLAMKHFHIDARRKDISNTLRKRINKFSTYDEGINRHIVSAPLIAQIGKNYASNFGNLITGKELLKIACNTVMDAQKLLGGRFVYLECEDTPRLIEFYEDNGFFPFWQRPLDPDETGIKGTYLVQMMKYLR